MVMWLRVQKLGKKRECDFDGDDDESPRQVVLNTPDGNFTVYEKYHEPPVKRWCPLSRIHSDHFKGDLIVPMEQETDTVVVSAEDDEQVYDYYRKADDKEYDFGEDVELFRIIPHLLDDDYVSSQDSQDSNAENYYTNDYPEDYWSD